LNPELFITLANVATQSMDQLIQAGIQVYTVGTVQDLDHIKELITEFGLMFGTPAAAQKIVDELSAQEDQAAGMVAARNVAEDQRPRVFMFGPMGDMETLQTWAPSGETIVEDLILKAGGRCITAEQGLTGWPQYSLEKLLESDPDIIILPISEAEFSSVEQFTSMELVRHLKAVRNNRVYGIESSLIWDMSFKNGRALVQIAEFINSI
jgi:iron complex transport system substrate-binding protein